MLRSPTKGLIIFIYYSTIAKLVPLLFLCLALAVATVATGRQYAFMLFRTTALSFLPMAVLMVQLHKSAEKWERLQVTMPVRRKNLLAAQFTALLTVTIIGLAIYAIVVGIATPLHRELLPHGILTASANAALAMSFTLMTAGFMYPLARTTAGEKWGDVIFIICGVAALGLCQLIIWVGSNLGLTVNAKAAAMVIATVVVFISSYFIAAKIYAKVDF